MADTEITRLARLIALTTTLQTKRTLTATELASRFQVSTRTIYRDIRTLESAGIPVVTIEGKGYAMLEGYRVSPVMFTQLEAIALLTAEKLVLQRTDTKTAQLIATATDKLRSALRHTDRDHLEMLTPHIQVLNTSQDVDNKNAYQLFLTAISMRQVVHLRYTSADSALPVERSVEPIGLYLSQHWHVVAYCRLRNAYRDFRLDRIAAINISDELFTSRPESLQMYWDQQLIQRLKQKVVIGITTDTMPPALLNQLNDTKFQYGFVSHQYLSESKIEMAFMVGDLSYIARWLLPFAGAINIKQPMELKVLLHQLAKKAYESFSME
jgi:predicted DNA-binding transcriptional regulator YafY